MSESATPKVLYPLWELPPDHPLKVEWDLFGRERPRLLVEGHEGRWVLIKREEIIGVFDNHVEAHSAGVHRFGVVDMLVQQILYWYRPLRQGYSRITKLELFRDVALPQTSRTRQSLAVAENEHE